MKDGIQSAVFTNNFDCKTIIVEELVTCIQSQLVVVDICYLTFWWRLRFSHRFSLMGFIDNCYFVVRDIISFFPCMDLQ